MSRENPRPIISVTAYSRDIIENGQDVQRCCRVCRSNEDLLAREIVAARAFICISKREREVIGSSVEPLMEKNRHYVLYARFILICESCCLCLCSSSCLRLDAEKFGGDAFFDCLQELL